MTKPHGEQIIELLDILSFKGMASREAAKLSVEELDEIITSAYQKIGALSVAVNGEIGDLYRLAKESNQLFVDWIDVLDQADMPDKSVCQKISDIELELWKKR